MMNFGTPYFSTQGGILVHGGDLVYAKRLRKQPDDCGRNYNCEICGVFAGRHYSTSIATWCALREEGGRYAPATRLSLWRGGHGKDYATPAQL